MTGGHCHSTDCRQSSPTTGREKASSFEMTGWAGLSSDRIPKMAPRSPLRSRMADQERAGGDRTQNSGLSTLVFTTHHRSHPQMPKPLRPTSNDPNPMPAHSPFPPPIRHRNRPQVAAAVFGLFSALLLGAAPEAGIVVELPPYPVAAPVIDSVIWERDSGKVTRLTQEQISSLNAGDLASALRRVPGVTVSRYGMVGSYGGSDGGAVFIRGHGTGRPGAEIVTLVDGIPRFVGVWTHPILDLLAIDSASTIEVYKSPQSVQFGNMAFGAVNLISKEAPGTPSAGEFHASYGRHATSTLRAETGLSEGPLDAYFVAASRSSDGHRPNASGSASGLYGHLGWQASESWRLSLRAHHNRGWARDPEPIGLSWPVPERFETKATLVYASAEHRGQDSSSLVQVFLDDGSLDWRQWAVPPPPPPGQPRQVMHTLTDFQNRGIRARHTMGLAQDWQATLGFDADSYGGQAKDVYHLAGARPSNGARFRSLAPWASLSRELQMADWNLTPTVGGRYHHSREFGGTWAGQTRLQAKRGAHGIHLEYARGFNLAGVYASIFSQRWGAGTSWRDLSPETIDHWEIGYQWAASTQLTFEASLFHDRSRHALRLTPPPASPPGLVNFPDFSITGVESSVRWRATEDLHLFASATWLNPSQSDLPAKPRWNTVLGGNLKLPAGFSVQADWQYLARQTEMNVRFSGPAAMLPPYALLQVRVAWEFETHGWWLQLFAAVENALDRHYSLRSGYPMPGRVATVGATLRL